MDKNILPRAETKLFPKEARQALVGRKHIVGFSFSLKGRNTLEMGFLPALRLLCLSLNCFSAPLLYICDVPAVNLARNSHR